MEKMCIEILGTSFRILGKLPTGMLHEIIYWMNFETNSCKNHKEILEEETLFDFLTKSMVNVVKQCLEKLPKKSLAEFLEKH